MKEVEKNLISDAFSERLKELLKEKGFNQKSLSVELKISEPTISRICKGNIPDVYTLVDISRVFGVSTDYLLNQSPFHTQDVDVALAGSILGFKNEKTAESIQNLGFTHFLKYGVMPLETFEKIVCHEHFAKLIYLSTRFITPSSSEWEDEEIANNSFLLWNVQNVFLDILKDLKKFDNKNKKEDKK